MKEQFIKNAQLAFLQDTINHFTLANRGTDGPEAGEGGGCRYAPAANSHGCRYAPAAHSQGCAIGRHILNKELAQEMDASHRTLRSYVESGSIGSLSALGYRFLADVQILHDGYRNWCDTGLSANGWGVVNELCYEHGLDRNLLTQLK